MDAGLSPDDAVVWAAGAKKSGEESLILDKMQDFILIDASFEFSEFLVRLLHKVMLGTCSGIICPNSSGR